MHLRTGIAGAGAVMLVLALVLAAGCAGPGTGGPGTPVPTTPPPGETTGIGETAAETREPTTQPTEVESVVEVVIRDLAFQPATLTIPPGTTVIWTNDDTVPHQIASDPHPAHTDLPDLVSGVLAPGESYRFTFATAGTFGYHCDLHPSMTGTLVVEE